MEEVEDNIISDAKVPSDQSNKRAKTVTPHVGEPLPDMSMLSGPTCHSWRRSEWAAWHEVESAHFEKLNSRESRPPHYDAWDGRFGEYFEQRSAAEAWTEPPEFALRVCVPGDGGAVVEVAVELLRRGEPRTFRAVIEAACVSSALNRDAFYWTPEFPDTRRATDRNDVLREEDAPCFSRLWKPSIAHFWENENTFCRRLIATPKPPPPPMPAEPPNFDLLSSPPPDGNAPAKEWASWRKANNFGTTHMWIQRHHAIRYRCPPVMPLRLQGVTHSVAVDAAADAPLSAAVAAFAASGDQASPMAASDFLIKDGKGDVLDQQTTTARCLFNGASESPLTLQVVHRDNAQAEAALAAKHGAVPDGYLPFRGLGYLVEDTEAPWIISVAHGVTAYNKAGESIGVYEGSDYGDRIGGAPTYDPIAKWWEMCALLKKDIASVARKPRGGWDLKLTEHALDRFTGIMLVTLINDEWRRDARGKILGWDPECRKESIRIMRQMDEAAAKLTHAARVVSSQENESPAPNGMLGLSRTIAQTERLLSKLQREYAGYATPEYSHHQGYLAFSKSLPLFDAERS